MDNRKIVYIDMDGVLVDFMSGVKKLDKQTYDKYNPDFDYIPGIFSPEMMDPIPGAIASYNMLIKRFRVFFLSKPSNKNPSSYTDKRLWINHHVGEFHGQFLILSPFKYLNMGDYLIDDRLVPGFGDIQLVFGSAEYPNWDAVMKYFDSVPD